MYGNRIIWPPYREWGNTILLDLSYSSRISTRQTDFRNHVEVFDRGESRESSPARLLRQNAIFNIAEYTSIIPQEFTHGIWLNILLFEATARGACAISRKLQ